MNLFEVVKASINIREAAQVYGIDVNDHGMALCPFHNDRHPSLYVSDDHYHCFACGEHGDVIDLPPNCLTFGCMMRPENWRRTFTLRRTSPCRKPFAGKINTKPEHSSFVRTSSCAFLF